MHPMTEMNDPLRCPSCDEANLIIHYIDVGHGDATLIQYKGKSFLIDAGSDEIGDTVPAYLRKSGVKTLEFVVASHPDSDHIGGMRDLLREFPPGRYYDNGEENDKPSYEKLMVYLERNQIPRTVGRAGMTISFDDDISITITSPSTLGDDMDENSICLLITFGSIRFFFPGDCETCDADADVVKLAHHGSKGAAKRALLSGTHPKTVIISVEKDKDDDLPAPSTMKALEKAGIEVHQTGKEGTIVLISDGFRYWFD